MQQWFSCASNIYPYFLTQNLLPCSKIPSKALYPETDQCNPGIPAAFYNIQQINVIRSIRSITPSKATKPLSRYSTSSFSYKDHLISKWSFNRCLRLLRRLPVNSIFPSVMCFKRPLLRQIGPITQTFLLIFLCIVSLSNFTQSNNSSISHAIVPNDLLHLHPAPHFKTFHLIIIYLLKCPIFSTKQCYCPNLEH